MGELASFGLDSRLFANVPADQEYLRAQRALYEEKREAEKQVVFNQLTARDTNGPSKNKSARLAAIISKQRLIV